MKLVTAIKHALDEASHALKKFKGVSDLVIDPKLSQTYYPELERKSKLSIWWDNLLWLARHREVNRYYYVYGLDRKRGINSQEFLPYNEFRRIRDRRNLNPKGTGYNYVCILRDKFMFSQVLTGLGFPAPKNIALLNSEQITWLADMRHRPLESLIGEEGIRLDGFCKKLAGILGKGAFPLRITGGKLFVKDAEISLSELKQRVRGEYLLQESIRQHTRMSELHPHSINTVRVITFNNHREVQVFSAALRIGTNNRSVDNWAAGGIVVGIDLDTGKLRKEGIFKPGYGGRVERHPDTGVALEGFEIPYFQKSIELACSLHRCLYGIHSVGWDIAITPQGPLFIEGNDDWEGGIPMSLETNFKSRFLKMYPARP